MVPNEALINALRKLLNYRFKRQTERVAIYQERGGARRVAIRKNASHSPEYALSILRSAGMGEDEAQRFLSQVNH